MSSKYFREMLISPHLDKRFGSMYSNYDKKTVRKILISLLNILVKLCKQHDIKCIIAHGTLIGHYFNKCILPWDNDIDVVLIGDSITKFMKLNKIQNKYFLIDINPHCLNRSPQDRLNVIDARVICKQTGYFIDVTFLTPNVGYSKDQNKVVVNCKSPHYYFLDDFLPLKEDKFEGIDVYIPNKIEKVLEYEYGKKVFLPRFEGWVFKDGEWSRSSRSSNNKRLIK